MPRTITTVDVLSELRKLDRETRNPMVGSGCVYTDYLGRHCIAGQILTNLDLPVPGFDDPSNNDGIEELLGYTGSATNYQGIEFTEGAVHILSQAQTLADSSAGPPSANGPRRVWGDVIDVVIGEHTET
jgi:hypothetical protein